MDPQILLIVGLVVLVIAAAIVTWWLEEKRKKAFAAVAQELGLSFQLDKDYHTPSRYSFLGKLDQGSNRYARYIFWGSYEDQQVTAFEYHYETYTHGKNGRATHHHYFSVFLLALPASFPELVVSPEGILSKLAQAVGYDDIDFESHEFSKKFCVRSADKKFAYDVCNARMMEYLLEHPDVMLEIEGPVLASISTGRFRPQDVRPALGRLCEVRARMPAYLFERRAAHA